MTVSEIAEKAGLNIISGSRYIDKEVTGVYICDLLSDVMGNANEGMLWVTLQTHKNIMAVATLKDLAGIILIKGLQPAADCAIQSETEKIPILGTELSAFDICGKLYTILELHK
jgi:hypothetical protein